MNLEGRKHSVGITGFLESFPEFFDYKETQEKEQLLQKQPTETEKKLILNFFLFNIFFLNNCYTFSKKILHVCLLQLLLKQIYF